MSRAALLEPPAPTGARGADTPSDGEQPTLGDVIASAWEGLLTVGRAPCPVCDGQIELLRGVAACEGCGSSLG